MNNFSHTDCNHPATPASRRRCRAARAADIRNAQALFMKAYEVNETPEIQEYEASVSLFAYRWNMTLNDAFDLIEKGPVVY